MANFRLTICSRPHKGNLRLPPVVNNLGVTVDIPVANHIYMGNVRLTSVVSHIRVT